MKRRCGAAVALVAVLVAGCGGGSDAAEETTTATAKAPPEPPTPALVEDLARQLNAAGFQTEVTPLEEGHSDIRVNGAEIVYYTDPSEAAKEGRELVKIATNHPKGAMADAYGQVIVWTAGTILTNAERARFEEISEIVDPQR